MLSEVVLSGGETLSFKAKLLFFLLAVTLFITCIKIVIN